MLHPINKVQAAPTRSCESSQRLCILIVLTALTAAGCSHTPPGGHVRSAASIESGFHDAARPDPASLPDARKRALKIDLSVQEFQYFEDDRLVLTSAVSSGTAEHPTPTGKFRVLRKEKDKVSRSYSNVLNMPTPMPYSLQFYGPYFIHEGWVPGYPDSHGCIRLHYEDARFLFARMRRGDTVLISGSVAGVLWLTKDEAGLVPTAGKSYWLPPDDTRRTWQRQPSSEQIAR